MNDCLFCKIVAKGIPSDTVYEDDTVYAFADIHPVNLGHTLVVPKSHYENLYTTPDETIGQIMAVAKKIAIAAKETLEAKGINIHINNDPVAGQVVFHTHIHVIPRFENDGFSHWRGAVKTGEEIHEAAEKIKKALG